MYFAPHTLQKKVISRTYDNYNRVVSESESWQVVCMCRCDDNSTGDIENEDGKIYRSTYHIVAEGSAQVGNGDYVRCMNADGSVRSEGRAGNVKHCNVLGYTDLYI